MNKNSNHSTFDFNGKCFTRLLAAFSAMATIITTTPAQADSAKLINPNNTHSYQRFDTIKTWANSKTACTSQGAHLATITSKAENDWLITNRLSGSTNTWLGATDSVTEGQWKWITGENWNYTNWNSGEPNNLGNEDYFHTSPSGVWNDLTNNSTQIGAYLCEWDNPLPPTLHSTAASPNAIQLSWDGNTSGAKAFRIQRKAGDCSSAKPWVTLVDVSAKTTEFQDMPLAANTAYSYQIASYYGAQSFSSYSACTSATTGIAGTPHIPSSITAASESTTSIALSWNDASTNETAFAIYRKTNTGSWTLLHKTAANAQHYRDTSASGNTHTTHYSYDVRACNAAGCSRANPSPVVVPFNPTNLVATVGTTAVHLAWNYQNSNETGFQIRRKNGNCASVTPWTTIAFPPSAGNITAYHDSNAVSNGTYAYQIRTYHEIGHGLLAYFFHAVGYSGFSNCVTTTAP